MARSRSRNRANLNGALQSVEVGESFVRIARDCEPSPVEPQLYYHRGPWALLRAAVLDRGLG